MILVDTSVLIAFLKGARTPTAARFAQMEEDEIPFAIPVVCFQDLLQGAA